MATNPNALNQRWPTPKGDEQDPANRLASQALQDLNQAIAALKQQLTDQAASTQLSITALSNRITKLGG